MDNVARHLQWVSTEIQKYESYHSHKETMAWVATAFYLTSVLTLAFLLRKDFQYATDIKGLATAAISLGGYLFWVFIYTQFCNRWIAADFQKGLMRLAADLCCGSAILPNMPEYNLDKDGRFPDHVYRYVEDSRPCRLQLLGSVLWLCTLRLSKVDDRLKTEIPSYALIVLALVVAILLLWVN